MTLINFLRRCAIAADKELISCRSVEKLPFIHDYPRGCCELVSIHLGLILQSSFSEVEVQIASAYDRDGDQWHYWVEMDNLVVDLTAYQFPQFETPLVCRKQNPLERKFPDVERISSSCALSAANFEINSHITKTLEVFSNCSLGSSYHKDLPQAQPPNP